MNKNTLTSTFCHKTNQVCFPLTYLFTSVATATSTVATPMVATDLDLRHK